MQYSELGRTGLKVSRVCLGTMTWGEQNSESEGHAQIERAKASGINFIDTYRRVGMEPFKAALYDQAGDTAHAA